MGLPGLNQYPENTHFDMTKKMLTGTYWCDFLKDTYNPELSVRPEPA